MSQSQSSISPSHFSCVRRRHCKCPAHVQHLFILCKLISFLSIQYFSQAEGREVIFVYCCVCSTADPCQCLWTSNDDRRVTKQYVGGLRAKVQMLESKLSELKQATPQARPSSSALAPPPIGSSRLDVSVRLDAEVGQAWF